MPVPAEYQRASDHFYEFLLDARNSSGPGSTHQAYTMVQGVLQAFRRRLELKDAIRFAAVLPALVRALFVVDWDTEEAKHPFVDRAAMTKEVQALRAGHNFASDTAISDVAGALRRHVDESVLEAVLAELPEGAIQFWQP